MSIACDKGHKMSDELWGEECPQCLLLAAIDIALKTLPRYEGDDFIDGEKCDIQFVINTLMKAVEKVTI